MPPSASTGLTRDRITSGSSFAASAAISARLRPDTPTWSIWSRSPISLRSAGTPPALWDILHQIAARRHQVDERRHVAAELPTVHAEVQPPRAHPEREDG